MPEVRNQKSEVRCQIGTLLLSLSPGLSHESCVLESKVSRQSSEHMDTDMVSLSTRAVLKAIIESHQDSASPPMMIFWTSYSFDVGSSLGDLEKSSLYQLMHPEQKAWARR